MPDHIDMRTSLALGRDAVTATSLYDLTDAHGVTIPLQRGDQQAIVLKPVPCCGHNPAAVAPPQQEGGIEPRFDTAEHAIICYGLKLQTESGPLDAARASLPVGLDSNFMLTYGQFIALGGDFYGDPDHPVCTSPDPLMQFSKNFASMSGAKSVVQAILAVADKYEFGPIAKAVSQNWQPSGVYMPRDMYRTFPPDETGATGQYRWPPVPGSMTGPYGATGPTLGATAWTWGIDGGPGPTQVPPQAG